MTSIRVRLLKWLIGPILLINLAAGALTYLLAWVPAQIAYDQSLTGAAGALQARLRPAPGALEIDLPPQAEQVLRADTVDAIYFVVRGADGRLVAGDADFPVLRAGAALAGTAAYDDRMRGEPVRVALVTAVAGGKAVQIGVAKTLRKRLQIHSAIVRILLVLETLFSLALAGLIWFTVTNGLQPLARMRSALNGRGGDDLAPVDAAAVPYELAPVVSAINGLLDKVQAGTRAQHDFLANMAHQLRTPLAGVKLQLEWLAERQRHDAPAMHAIGLMLSSNERMIRQTNQLLALARAEPSHFEKTRLAALDLAVLVEESVQSFVEQAGRKQIDLGFELAPAPLAGERFLLRDLVDNLVDNALRYTAPGGTVTVRCQATPEATLLVVEDSGPGIAPAQRGQVFHRFARLDESQPGSGLGLAIVRDIALAHGASVEIGDPATGTGAVFTVRFPAPAARPL